MNARARRYAPHKGGDVEEGGHGRRDLLFWLALLVIVALSAFIWNFYGGRDVPRIVAPSEPYKIAPSPEMSVPDAAEISALDSVIEGRPTTESAVTARPGPEAPILDNNVTAPAARPSLSVAPQFVSNGPYVAQVAALRSEAGVQTAWNRLASRAPALFENARLDVERADLGQNGYYYRIRAGYFADRENAGRFCDRIKAMGQDCIAVRR
ncbi:MAG: SPOR domain-containing protein [Caulobacterales bacterium]